MAEPYRPPHRSTVKVRGGDLTIGTWGTPEQPPVLAIHGINDTHMAWGVVAQHLTGARLIAPDLRGRGRSSDLPGPWGLRQHAEDALRILDAAEIERAVIAGHSMGGPVALFLAEQHPDRVQGLVLLDGGLEPPKMHGDPEWISRHLLRELAHRLTTTFASREEYRNYRAEEPGLTGEWTPARIEALDYEVVGSEPQLRYTASFDGIAQDSADMRNEVFLPALEALQRPAIFLRAMLPLREGGKLYDTESVTERLPLLEARDVTGVNHFTLMNSPEGATAVVQAIHDMLNRSDMSPAPSSAPATS